MIVPGMEMDRNIEGFAGVHCFHTVCLGTKDSTYAQEQTFPARARERPGGVPEGARRPARRRADDDLLPSGVEQHAGAGVRPAARQLRHGDLEHGCALENGLDTNAAYWDELLMQGKKIYGVATDDGHHMYHHCKGWVRVNAERNAGAILAALGAGAFYSSCGPEIHDFYVEDGVAVVTCSPCAEIVFRCGQYPCPRISSREGDLTRHEFALPEYLDYIRAVVRDQGRTPGLDQPHLPALRANPGKKSRAPEKNALTKFRRRV